MQNFLTFPTIPNLLDVSNELTITSILVRLLMAMIFGGIIGLDRGVKGSAAGFRTYMLVCLGATLVMITNQFIVETNEYASDPGRFGAQVISGIGFLGAGTIIVTSHHRVKGLTTAAGLWASACLGLAIGIGFYAAAVIAGTLILVVVSVMHKLEGKLNTLSRHMDIYVEFSGDGRLNNLIDLTKEKKIAIMSIEFTKSKFINQQAVATILTLQLPHHSVRQEIKGEILKLPGIIYLEEI